MCRISIVAVVNLLLNQHNDVFLIPAVLLFILSLLFKLIVDETDAISGRSLCRISIFSVVILLQKQRNAILYSYSPTSEHTVRRMSNKLDEDDI